jgi:hypothetical protein
VYFSGNTLVVCNLSGEPAPEVINFRTAASPNVSVHC